MTAKGIKREIRSFIAIDLPPAFLEAIVSLQDELKHSRARIRWVKSGNIHLTLKFLGNVRSELLDELGDILASACKAYAPFELSMGTPGGFPNLKRPRVIWLGVEGELDRLDVLSQDIESGCLSAGLAEEKRRFHPHLTLGRVKDWRKRSANLADLLARTKAVSTGTFSVKAVHLYKSDLTRDGAVYTKLKSFPFKQEK